MGSLFDANEEDGEKDFDKESRPVSQPVSVEEEKDKLIIATPEDETRSHVPIKDAVLSKINVTDI